MLVQVHPGTDFCTEYERSKCLADTIARDSAREGVNIVLLYPGVIYGVGNLTNANIIAELVSIDQLWTLALSCQEFFSSLGIFKNTAELQLKSWIKGGRQTIAVMDWRHFRH